MRTRKDRAFRPQLAEILEARAVPSLAGVTLPTGIPGISVTGLPSQISPSNPQVHAAFVAFDQSYIRAVDSILLASGTDDFFIPSSSRAALDRSIEQSLTTLVDQLVGSLSPGSTTTTAPTSPTITAAANQITAAIVGGGADSLQSQLRTLSLAQIEVSVPNPSAGTAGSIPALVPNAVTTAEQVRPTVRVPVAEAVGPATTGTGATSSATESPSSPSTGAAQGVRSAFNNFLNDYFQSVQKVLLAPGSNGQVDPASNRAAFDAQVAESLRSLQARLSTTLARYPSTSGLGPQFRSSLGGSGLQGQLAGLATPQGARAAVVREFTLGSTRAIARALSLISGDVSRLMAPAGP